MRQLVLVLFALLVSTMVSAQTTLTDAGWHLVHLGTETDVEQFLENHPNIQSVWSWDNQWAVKHRDASSTSSTTLLELKQIEAKRGYWINISAPVTLSESTDAWVNSLYDFSDLGTSGWQLLGTSVELDAIGFFDGVLSEGGTVWQWNNQAWAVYTTGDTAEENQFNTQNNTSFENLRTLGAHQGFWVNYNACGGQPPVQLGSSALQSCIADTMNITFPLDASMVCSMIRLNCATSENMVLDDLSGLEAFVGLEAFEVTAKDISVSADFGDLNLPALGITLTAQGNLDMDSGSQIVGDQIVLEVGGNLTAAPITAGNLEITANGEVEFEQGLSASESITITAGVGIIETTGPENIVSGSMTSAGITISKISSEAGSVTTILENGSTSGTATTGGSGTTTTGGSGTTTTIDSGSLGNITIGSSDIPIIFASANTETGSITLEISDDDPEVIEIIPVSSTPVTGTTTTGTGATTETAVGAEFLITAEIFETP